MPSQMFALLLGQVVLVLEREFLIKWAIKDFFHIDRVLGFKFKGSRL
jgi:hypothetical protein